MSLSKLIDQDIFSFTLSISIAPPVMPSTTTTTMIYELILLSNCNVITKQQFHSFHSYNHHWGNVNHKSLKIALSLCSILKNSSFEFSEINLLKIKKFLFLTISHYFCLLLIHSILPIVFFSITTINNLTLYTYCYLKPFYLSTASEFHIYKPSYLIHYCLYLWDNYHYHILFICYSQVFILLYFIILIFFNFNNLNLVIFII